MSFRRDQALVSYQKTRSIHVSVCFGVCGYLPALMSSRYFLIKIRFKAIVSLSAAVRKLMLVCLTECRNTNL